MLLPWQPHEPGLMKTEPTKIHGTTSLKGTTQTKILKSCQNVHNLQRITTFCVPLTVQTTCRHFICYFLTKFLSKLMPIKHL